MYHVNCKYLQWLLQLQSLAQWYCNWKIIALTDFNPSSVVLGTLVTWSFYFFIFKISLARSRSLGFDLARSEMDGFYWAFVFFGHILPPRPRPETRYLVLHIKTKQKTEARTSV